MTKQELNRDCKRLLKLAIENSRNLESEGQIRSEIQRLYCADREFRALNRQSILILLRLNLRYRAIPLHNFGLFIELKKM